MNRRIDALLEEFERTLAESSFPASVQVASAAGLRRQVRKFRSENRDGRGVEANAGKLAQRLVRRMTLAVQHADGHANSEVRRSAKALVRSAQHVPFEELAAMVGAFYGLLNKTGHRAKEKAKLEARKRYTIGKPEDDLAAVELITSDQLASTGRDLGVCVAYKRGGPGRGYHVALREGDSYFFRLETARNRTARGLIEVSRDTDQVVETAGIENDDLELPCQRVALDILRNLDATADDIEAFSEVGAFDVFLEGVPKRSWIRVGDGKYKLWCFPERGRVVLKKKQGSWSLFSCPRRRSGRRRPARRLAARRRSGTLGNWRAVSSHDGSLEVGDLLDLALRSDEFAAALRVALPK